MNVARALLCSAAFSLVFATGAVAATSRPAVKLHLSGDLLSMADGKTHAVPLEKAVVKKGDLVRYTIVAVNAGSRPAVSLNTVGPVPQRTAYVRGSASHAAGARVEFSLDGKRFSAVPLVVRHTPKGNVSEPADPSLYVAIRWVATQKLPPKGSAQYSYEVRVK